MAQGIQIFFPVSQVNKEQQQKNSNQLDLWFVYDIKTYWVPPLHQTHIL